MVPNKICQKRSAYYMGAEIQIKKLTYHYGQNAELKNVIIQSLSKSRCTSVFWGFF